MSQNRQGHVLKVKLTHTKAQKWKFRTVKSSRDKQILVKCLQELRYPSLNMINMLYQNESNLRPIKLCGIDLENCKQQPKTSKLYCFQKIWSSTWWYSQLIPGFIPTTIRSATNFSILHTQHFPGPYYYYTAN